MNVLACIKRVPAPGSRITLTPDGDAIDTAFLGFTVSPHEECAVEAAVQLVETHGGSSTVLTLGPPEAVEQVRTALSCGIDQAVHLVTDGHEWDPQATAAAIVDAVRAEQERDAPYDVMLFGNDSADSAGYQVGVRVAYELGLPFVTGVSHLELRDNAVIAKRAGPAGVEVFEANLPAVVAVKEGVNLPRYPSVPGRLRARSKPIIQSTPENVPGGLRMRRLVVPDDASKDVQILGTGPDAAPAAVSVLAELGVI